MWSCSTTDWRRWPPSRLRYGQPTATFVAWDAGHRHGCIRVPAPLPQAHAAFDPACPSHLAGCRATQNAFAHGCARRRDRHRISSAFGYSATIAIGSFNCGTLLGAHMMKAICPRLVALLGLALLLLVMAPTDGFAQSCPAGNKRCGDGCIPNNWQCCSHTAYHTRDKNKGVPCGAGATCCFNPQSQNSMGGHFCCAPGDRCDVSAGKRSGRCVR
jgi:hypothetical protein